MCSLHFYICVPHSKVWCSQLVGYPAVWCAHHSIMCSPHLNICVPLSKVRDVPDLKNIVHHDTLYLYMCSIHLKECVPHSKVCDDPYRYDTPQYFALHLYIYVPYIHVPYIHLPFWRISISLLICSHNLNLHICSLCIPSWLYAFTLYVVLTLCISVVMFLFWRAREHERKRSILFWQHFTSMHHTTHTFAYTTYMFCFHGLRLRC